MDYYNNHRYQWDLKKDDSCRIQKSSFGCLVTLYFLYRPHTFNVKKGIKPPSGRNYDLFISVPMAAFDTEDEFVSFHKTILDIKAGIKQYCKIENVFYAGNKIESPKDFELGSLSIVEDYDACFRSKYFILIYPQKWQLVRSLNLDGRWLTRNR